MVTWNEDQLTRCVRKEGRLNLRAHCVWDRRITFSKLTDVAARDGDLLREKLPALPELRQACEFSSARSVADVSLKGAATGMCRNPGNHWRP
jgi:hypothetical protein